MLLHNYYVEMLELCVTGHCHKYGKLDNTHKTHALKWTEEVHPGLTCVGWAQGFG